ncbi:MAG: hypothetical protein EA408_04820 [Marinilabiliales bacterium]|nr:MAG: hypothetical protein EA408_04820 [Marinilabiliales bacterium]
MLRTGLLAILLLVRLIEPAAQNWNRIHMLDQDGGYMIMNKLYADAAANYIRILNELPGNANIKFRIGYCYFNAEGHLEDAITYLEKASANSSAEADVLSLREDRSPPEVWLLLGKAYQRANRFEAATQAYNRYRGMMPEDDEGYRLAGQYIKSIDNLKGFTARPHPVDQENLGRGINSNDADVNAVISGDGTTMAFTRISKRGFDVFVSRRRGDEWGRPVNITRHLRRDFLMTTGISYNGNELYLVYYVPDASDIYTSSFENGEWSRARSIGRPVNSRHNETHASVSADGSRLYFTSDRPGGFGGLDIYRATLDGRGRWRDVVNMGSSINTSFNEETPFVTTDGRFLFFSSEGHNSMGGYDVFYVDLENPAVVHNLGYPVNDAGDNLFWFPVGDGRSGYVSLHDENGIGRSDIHRVTMTEPEAVFAHLGAKDEPAEPVQERLLADEARPVDEAAGEPVGDTPPVVMDVPDPEYDPVPHDPAPEPDIAGIYDPVDTFDPADETDLYEPDIDDLRVPSVLPAHIAEGRSYSVQFLALAEPVSADLAGARPGVIIHYDRDGINRLITGYYRTEAEALPVLTQLRDTGYPEAFIRINNIVPNYTIQLMAMNNYLDGSHFSNLDEVMCIRGNDGLYRYSYGLFSSRDEAESEAGRLRELGYEDLFIRQVDWQGGNQ